MHERLTLPVPKVLVLTKRPDCRKLFTVWRNLFQRAGLKPEKPFDSAAAAALAQLQIQIAAGWVPKYTRQQVVRRNCATCTAWRNARTINYREQDFVAALKPKI